MRTCGSSAFDAVVLFNQFKQRLTPEQEAAYGRIAEAYDAANVALRALRLTNGDPDGPKMTAALERAGKFVGTIGTFNFSPDDHYGLPASDLRMAKWSGTGWILQK